MHDGWNTPLGMVVKINLLNFHGCTPFFFLSFFLCQATPHSLPPQVYHSRKTSDLQQGCIVSTQALLPKIKTERGIFENQGNLIIRGFDPKTFFAEGLLNGVVLI